MDVRDFDRISDVISEFADSSEAEQIINEYLREDGGELIKQKIHEMLPVSGRKPWKGKKTAAKATEPFRKTAGNLSVKVHTKSAYHYLYFPDDGSDTERHYGNQQFMFDGASQSSETIANEVIEELVKRLEET